MGDEKPRSAQGSKPKKTFEKDTDLETFRIEVGHAHGVEPRNIVGAIANEAGVDSAHIGRIDIRDDHSLVDLPKGMPGDVFEHLKTVWVANRQLGISRVAGAPAAPPPGRKPKKPKTGKPAKLRKAKLKNKGKRNKKPDGS